MPTIDELISQDPNNPANKPQSPDEPSPLDTILNVIKRPDLAARGFSLKAGGAINQFTHDVDVASNPGWGKDLLGWAGEELSKPQGTQLEDYPNVNRVLNVIKNVGRVAGIDPSDPDTLLAAIGGPVSKAGEVAKGVEELGNVSKLKESLAAKGAPTSAPVIKPATQFAPYEDIVKPGLDRLESYLDDIHNESQLSKGVIREQAGLMTRSRLIENDALMSEYGRAFTKSKADTLNVFDDIETGKFADALKSGDASKLSPGWTSEDFDTAKIIDGAFQRRREAISALEKADGKPYLKTLYSNYLGHMYDKPQQARNFFDALSMKDTVAEGSQAFRKERTIERFREGIEQGGLQPKSWNWIELQIMKMQEVDRFLLAHNVKNALEYNGLIAKAGEEGVKIPSEWVPLNDRVFAGDKYYAPQSVANNFNNYFSPGLAGTSKVYDWVREGSNFLNQLKYGFSAFHAAMTTVNSMTSDLALAFKQFESGAKAAFNGDLSYAGKKAGQVISSVGQAAVPGWSVTRDLLHGPEMRNAYLNPGSNAKFAEEARALQVANGRVSIDPIYMNKAINAYKQAVAHGEYGRATLRALPAIGEAIARPIMEKMVPNVKLGAFQRLATNILEDAEHFGWSEDKVRQLTQKAWDSIDNRFGQIAYDNTFHHKVLKDLSMIAMRAPGWHLGTFREIGGGVMDLGKESVRAIAERQFNLSDRLAFTLAMPLAAGYMGALTTLAFTGRAPNDWRDYFFPPDGGTDAYGNPTRMNVWSYMKDAFQMLDVATFKKSPVDVVKNWMGPAFQSSSQLLQNKDWLGTQIFHPGDGLGNAGNLAKWAAKEISPISVGTFGKRIEEGGLTGGVANVGKVIAESILSSRAPSEFIRTPAQNKLAEIAARQAPASRTIEETKKRNDMRQLEGLYRNNKIGEKELINAVGKGQLTQQQAVNIVMNKGTPIIVRAIKNVRDPKEALQVYQLGNPQEKQLIGGIVGDKLRNAWLKDIGNNELKNAYSDFIMSINQGKKQ